MEDALAPYYEVSHEYLPEVVLILVVMEDALALQEDIRKTKEEIKS